MALKPGALYKFPWEDMGTFKYLLFVPFAATVALGMDDADDWAFHMLVIAAVRYVHSQFWISLSRIHAVTQNTKIQAKGIDFKQVDREDHWDDFIILQAIIMTLVHKCPGLGYNGVPTVQLGGAVAAPSPARRADGVHLLLAAPRSPPPHALQLVPRAPPRVFRHRAHHRLRASFHGAHHVHRQLRHPAPGTWAFGGASIAMFYAYLIGFDLLNNIGHCNFEFMPQWFMSIPGMKYLIYTPTYHSLHHSKVHVNFCLFMPIYDVAYGTNDPSSDELYRKAINGEAAPNKAPDVVFVAHGTELLSLFHLPFALRSFSSKPFKSVWWLQPFLPLCLPDRRAAPAGREAVHRGQAQAPAPEHGDVGHPGLGIPVLHQVRVQPHQPADRAGDPGGGSTGTKVVGLGALNKNEALNGGGQLFVDKHPNLRVRVVHGNTLTAAAILRKYRADVKEIFLTGSTSKLGRGHRAVPCRSGGAGGDVHDGDGSVREDSRGGQAGGAKLITQATTLEEGAGIKDWVIGKHCGPRDQEKAPKHATFHQFVVPPIPETRSDCVYTDLPAFRLPKEAKDFRSCEMTMERGHVHACHAGALVHALEGWEYNEVGAIDHAKIDVTWDAAMKHGFALA